MKRAIIIGAGKSFFNTPLIEELASSKFEGMILLSDRIAGEAIHRGIDPLKFNVSIATQEGMKNQDEINRHLSMYREFNVMKNRRNFDVYLATIVDPFFDAEICRDFKVKYFIRAGKAECIKIKDNLPVIDTCSNVGSACWSIARQLFGCTIIGMIGLDYGSYSKDTSVSKWEVEKGMMENMLTRYKNEILTCNFSPYCNLDIDFIRTITFQRFIENNYNVDLEGVAEIDRREIEF